MSQQAFEQYLKNSDFFHDALNTHRAATGEVFGSLLCLMRENGQVTVAQLKELLTWLGRPSPSGSRDGSRRAIAAAIELRLRDEASDKATADRQTAAFLQNRA
jgi:hypothetical protein